MPAVADRARAPHRAAGRGRTAGPRSRQLPADAVAHAALTLIVLGGLAVVALWWKDTFDVIGAAGWLTGAGRITGLLAGYLTPLLLLLMARVPVLEQRVGSDRLARWHAITGRYMVSLVAAHILTIIWGYAYTARKSFAGETVYVVFDYPEMLKGTAAALLMFGTAFVSARAARRRLSYETWYYLHLATYLAVALGFSHQIVNGADLNVGGARLLWSAYYVGAFAVLGWYRIIVPWRNDKRHRLRVAEVRAEAPGVVSVVLTGEHLDDLRAEAGQFFRLQFQTKGLRWAANPYSLSAAAHPNFLRFTVKDLGQHSAAVARLQPGTKVRAEGPYGAFTAKRVRGRKVLLLAGGVGITPIRALFETLPARRGDLTLLYRASWPEDVIFRQELEAIASARGARLRFLVGPRAEVGDPLTARTLARLVPHLNRHDVFICGPEPMAAAAVAALRKCGVKRSRIHHESFVF
ncbi:ferric reductase-like transmembrane domain-containing protein [Actinocrinis puniceicyclus]|uniref:Ferric reductase-like transmembrane domain-containing protein n=1 Tax=Actinocrinis puniceicyclus TaxID=977794 RepID=A0A8J7WSN3_9ACTN|nr:ferric reductase-like transmembrane domain-containing protein [Actinocrinis puniceicyclus]MBS2965742.1 ferric reductase-like transmembrane domain-containing protein [Actinocrinis puniceicyclus]